MVTRSGFWSLEFRVILTFTIYSWVVRLAIMGIKYFSLSQMKILRVHGDQLRRALHHINTMKIIWDIIKLHDNFYEKINIFFCVRTLWRNPLPPYAVRTHGLRNPLPHCERTKYTAPDFLHSPNVAISICINDWMWDMTSVISNPARELTMYCK